MFEKTYDRKKDFEREGGVKVFPGKLPVSQCRKIPEKNPLVFHYFRVSKTNYASECYVSISSRDFCCLTKPKSFLGEPFCAVLHIFYGSEKDYE